MTPSDESGVAVQHLGMREMDQLLPSAVGSVGQGEADLRYEVVCGSCRAVHCKIFDCDALRGGLSLVAIPQRRPDLCRSDRAEQTLNVC